MIVFPSAKINLGLSILDKRKDGYHNLESVFYPIPIYDCLEFIESKKMKFHCNIKIDKEKSNSVLKAYELLKTKYKAFSNDEIISWSSGRGYFVLSFR